MNKTANKIVYLRSIVVLFSFFVLAACGGPDDPYKDVRIQENDSPKIAFEKRVKFLERKILEYPDFEIAKRKYGIKKWGESLKTDLENPMVQLPSGECFDLSNIPDPWFVSQLYFSETEKDKNASLIGNTQHQAVDFFDIDVRMRDLQLPFSDMVKSDIWIDRLQEYMFVRVTAQPVFGFFGPTYDEEEDFLGYQSYINKGLWRPVEREGVEFGEWKFVWYKYKPRLNDLIILTDLEKQAIIMANYWDVEAASLGYHTDEGYPFSSYSALTIPPTGLYPNGSNEYRHMRRDFTRRAGAWKSPVVNFGKRIYDTGYGYQVMFSALSTPHTAEIFSSVDAIIENIKTECK